MSERPNTGIDLALANIERSIMICVHGSTVQNASSRTTESQRVWKARTVVAKRSQGRSRGGIEQSGGVGVGMTTKNAVCEVVEAHYSYIG